jgi:hypothetical protein
MEALLTIVLSDNIIAATLLEDLDVTNLNCVIPTTFFAALQG